MKEVIKIEGGHRLNGNIRVSGAKNATVALIPAAVLGTKTVHISGIPDISDVNALKEILEYLDNDVLTPQKDEIIINPEHMVNKPLVIDAVGELRASYYFMGALLGKYHNVIIKMPGGCDLGPRPIDLHLKGFEALGATIEYKNDNYYLNAETLHGADIYLNIASVGATINIILASVLAEGRTTIENAAKEPEIIDVANLLNKMGANIRGAGTSTITIDGVEQLGGCNHEVIPDRIEAGTFIILASAMADYVKVQNVIPAHIEALISKLRELGVNLKTGIDFVEVFRTDELKAIDIKTGTYPSFATDLQAPLTALLTQAKGNSTVFETIYKDRFKHCYELNKMGANIIVNHPASTIVGPTKLHGAEVQATDLRAGACMAIAALIADGITTIDEIHHIDRGYDNFDKKLSSIGAKIWREVID